jgi:hypothetical protein
LIIPAGHNWLGFQQLALRLLDTAKISVANMLLFRLTWASYIWRFEEWSRLEIFAWW